MSSDVTQYVRLSHTYIGQLVFLKSTIQIIVRAILAAGHRFLFLANYTKENGQKSYFGHHLPNKLQNKFC